MATAAAANNNTHKHPIKQTQRAKVKAAAAAASTVSNEKTGPARQLPKHDPNRTKGDFRGHVLRQQLGWTSELQKPRKALDLKKTERKPSDLQKARITKHFRAFAKKAYLEDALDSLPLVVAMDGLRGITFPTLVPNSKEKPAPITDAVQLLKRLDIEANSLKSRASITQPMHGAIAQLLSRYFSALGHRNRLSAKDRRRNTAADMHSAAARALGGTYGGGVGNDECGLPPIEQTEYQALKITENKLSRVGRKMPGSEASSSPPSSPSNAAAATASNSSSNLLEFAQQRNELLDHQKAVLEGTYTRTHAQDVLMSDAVGDGASFCAFLGKDNNAHFNVAPVTLANIAEVVRIRSNALRLVVKEDAIRERERAKAAKEKSDAEAATAAAEDEDMA